MSRNPNNNPTERICRLLEEIEELQNYCGHLYARLPPEATIDLLPKPPMTNYQIELVIQSRNFRKNTPDAIYRRRSMQRIRERGGSVKKLVEREDQFERLDRAEIDKRIKKLIEEGKIE